jgi:hypothetical protein
MITEKARREVTRVVKKSTISRGVGKLCYVWIFILTIHMVK